MAVERNDGDSEAILQVKRPRTTRLSSNPFGQQNRATSTWVNFAPEHLDVDRPGDK
jgi:hypothetical protein